MNKTSTKNKRTIIRLDAQLLKHQSFSFLEDYSNKISSIPSQFFVLQLRLSVKRPFVKTSL